MDFPVGLAFDPVLGVIPGGTGAFAASALARPGVLRSDSGASADVPRGSFVDIIVVAQTLHSSFLLDDVMISGGAPGEVIMTSANVSLGGVIGGLLTGINPTFAADAHVGVSGTGNLSGSLTIRNGVEILESTGIFSSSGPGAVDIQATTPSFPVTVGVPLTIAFNLETSALVTTGAVGTPPSFASAFADFSVGFPTVGPVFNLPPGFTTNSPDGFIVDNRFTGGAPVPEPSSLLLLGSGLSAMGTLAWRRQRRKPI